MEQQSRKKQKMSKMKVIPISNNARLRGDEKMSMCIRKAMTHFSEYLKSHNIYFQSDITEEDTPRITMGFKNCEMCPGKITEGCIYFFEDCMEIRVYYSALGTEICKKSKNVTDLYRVFNFLNARLWPRVIDGMNGTLYRSQYLFYPRFYITEDGESDITTAMIVPYTHFEMDELETEDFITAALPDLLNGLSTPIFMLLMGRMSVEEAIASIKADILGE